MQPAAVASPTGAAAARDPGFGGCAGVRAAHAGPLGPETLAWSPARVAHGTLGRADPADSPVWQPLQIVSSQRSSSALLTPAPFPLSLPRVARDVRPPQGRPPHPNPGLSSKNCWGSPVCEPTWKGDPTSLRRARKKGDSSWGSGCRNLSQCCPFTCDLRIERCTRNCGTSS